MTGRSGVDNLSVALLITGLVLSILSTVFASSESTVLAIVSTVLNLLGFACDVFCIFRMFSRNVEKRREENRRYLAFTGKITTGVSQAFKRFKLRKQYKYFKCPNCKVRMRLPRGKGVVTVTCKCCKNSFTQKS